MPASTLETILAALFTALDGEFAGTLKRNEPLPETIPDDGLAILWDGDPGEPEVTMSPLTYHYEHTAELLLFVQARTASARNSAFDARKLEIAAAISADQTLGGLCDWVEARAPSTEDLPVIGGQSIKSALIPITLNFATSNPLT